MRASRPRTRSSATDGPRPRTAGRKRSRKNRRGIISAALQQLPAFLKLLTGLLRDPRVSGTDKALVAGAIGYVLLPTDLVIDYLPFLGMVDDLFLVSLTIRRLLRNAGYRRALRYWSGGPADLRALKVERVVDAAAALLPRRIRRRLEAGR